MFPFGWIYLLQERAHLGSKIFKLGRTVDISTRLKARDYRKSMLICAMYCPGVRSIDDETPNYKIAEENLKASFIEKFGPAVAGEGSETFQGEVTEMIDMIHQECNSRRIDWSKHEKFFNKYFVYDEKTEEKIKVDDILENIRPRGRPPNDENGRPKIWNGQEYIKDDYSVATI